MIFGEHVKIREEKFGSAIFETLREKVFVTNESGREVLRLFQQGRSAQEVSDRLKDQYAAAPGQVEEDVARFLSCLQDNHIITKEG